LHGPALADRSQQQQCQWDKQRRDDGERPEYVDIGQQGRLILDELAEPSDRLLLRIRLGGSLEREMRSGLLILRRGRLRALRQHRSSHGAPMLPPRLRATLISEEAWLVSSGGRPAYDKVVIGTNRKGMPFIW
jgi:hypothetical protein